jgi:hypothetical protein
MRATCAPLISSFLVWNLYTPHTISIRSILILPSAKWTHHVCYMRPTLLILLGLIELKIFIMLRNDLAVLAEDYMC